MELFIKMYKEEKRLFLIIICPAFPWIEINNLDELPLHLTEQLMKIAVDTYRTAGDIRQAMYHEALLEDYRKGIGHRKETDCR